MKLVVEDSPITFQLSRKEAINLRKIHGQFSQYRMNEHMTHDMQDSISMDELRDIYDTSYNFYDMLDNAGL